MNISTFNTAYSMDDIEYWIFTSNRVSFTKWQLDVVECIGESVKPPPRFVMKTLRITKSGTFHPSWPICLSYDNYRCAIESPYWTQYYRSNKFSEDDELCLNSICLTYNMIFSSVDCTAYFNGGKFAMCTNREIAEPVDNFTISNSPRILIKKITPYYHDN